MKRRAVPVVISTDIHALGCGSWRPQTDPRRANRPPAINFSLKRPRFRFASSRGRGERGSPPRSPIASEAEAREAEQHHRPS
jgi:hypothetical protein